MLPTNGSPATGALVGALFAWAAIASAARGQATPSTPAGMKDQRPPVRACSGRTPLSPEELRRTMRVGGERFTHPKRTFYERPVYPALAKDRHITGVVVLEALLDSEGIVRSTQILRSIPLLDQAAADAACEWQFTPSRIDGVPVPCALTLAINFPPAEGDRRQPR